jgi:spore photoproduct lyase
MVKKLIASIDQLIIHEESRNAEVTQRLLHLFPKEKVLWVDSPPLSDQQGEMSAREYAQSKKRLFVTPFKGNFFKRCPGASQKKTLTCCNYYVLNLGLQCNMNCSYCYLQSYLNTPVMTVFSNIDRALEELAEIAQSQGQSPLRVGTGEVIDSLSLDPLTLYTRPLIEFFAKVPNWTLELKTKSNHVAQFLDCSHSGNVVVSWSINPQAVIEHEEHGTATLEERLTAAESCVRKGFPIAFHLDPMIYHEDWQTNYENLIRELTQRFKSNEIHGITVGTLRFQPEQRHIMRERFGMRSWITQAEVFPSESGKLRYDSQLRTSMFRFAIDTFKKYSDWPISLCMETPETWIATYEKLPSQMEELKTFYRPIKRIAPLLQPSTDSSTS